MAIVICHVMVLVPEFKNVTLNQVKRLEKRLDEKANAIELKH